MTFEGRQDLKRSLGLCRTMQYLNAECRKKSGMGTNEPGNRLLEVLVQGEVDMDVENV